MEAKILANLPFEANDEQRECVGKLSEFLRSEAERAVFLLKGYAGSGKTSIVSAVVKALLGVGKNAVLLAPTGRAAKVFSAYSSAPAFSIHKQIYRQKSASENRFVLNFNKFKNTVFIVDEASMISTAEGEGIFGSGNLLSDLIEFVFSGEKNKMILIGDDAQLPPISQNNSPALRLEVLESFFLKVTQARLQKVARQHIESGILFNATYLRRSLAEKNFTQKPVFKLDFPDIKMISGTDLPEILDRHYAQFGGTQECLIITRSNKMANIYNKGIRAQVLFKEEEISSGDRVLVTKNNYFWKKEKNGDSFIANGDILRILRIRRQEEMYGFRFVNATVSFEDEGEEFDVKILLDALYTETSADIKALNDRLFSAILEDYADIENNRKKFQELRKNDFFNALQVKFAYAATCHKAQGGQWSVVMIDQGFITPENYNINYYRWLYTAFTRAKERLYLVNFPE